LTPFESSLTLPIPHVELPNLDMGGLSNFRVFDSSFQFQWEHPPIDTSRFLEMQRNVQGMEEGLQILYRERGIIGQQVESIEFKIDQIKNFANFVTQWQECFTNEVQGMARGTTNSIQQLEEMANKLCAAINGVHNMVDQHHDFVRADHESMHQNLRDLSYRL
jgi:hypothetical protein